MVWYGLVKINWNSFWFAWSIMQTMSKSEAQYIWRTLRWLMPSMSCLLFTITQVSLV